MRSRTIGHVLALLGWTVLNVTRSTLITCMSECSMQKRQGYCPVRDAPTQIFDGYDGIDSHFDLQHRSLIFIPCKASNYSQMGYQWQVTEGEGYSVRGEIISQHDLLTQFHTGYKRWCYHLAISAHRQRSCQSFGGYR